MIPLGAFPPLVFDMPWLLLGAVIIPLMVWAMRRRAMVQRAERLRRLADPALLAGLTDHDPSRERARTVRLVVASLLLGLAVAGPRWGLASGVTRVEGIDMVIAMDASLSMLATDERPNRLERMKREVRRLRAMAPSDRVALIAFAGRSYILAPLTTDDGALALYLDHLDPSVVGQAGSSLSRAIRQGTELLVASDGAADRALVVMSDGESFEDVGPLQEAAEAARDAGISLVMVGFGSTRGSTIPVRDGAQATEKRDESGDVVVTRHDPALMQQAATWAGGTFVPANAVDKASRIRQALRSLKTARRTLDARQDYVPRQLWLLLPAFLLIAIDSGPWRRRPRVPLARAVGVAAVTVSSMASCRQPPDPAVIFAEGRINEAIRAYRSQLAHGDSTPRTMYNLGTALAGADSLREAAVLLESARRLADGDVRFRARFNAGLAALKMARATGKPAATPTESEASAQLDAARRAYRAMLMERPGYRDAQWNYELALRTTPPSSGGGGSGGQGGGTPPQPSTSDPDTKGGGLDRRQAEALLDNAAREEGVVQGRRVRGARIPSVGKDW